MPSPRAGICLMLFAVAAELLSWPAVAQTRAEFNVGPEQKIRQVVEILSSKSANFHSD